MSIFLGRLRWPVALLVSTILISAACAAEEDASPPRPTNLPDATEVFVEPSPVPAATKPTDGPSGQLLPETTTYQKREDVPYADDGDPDHMLTAYLPDGDGPFPALIIVHGGSWMIGSRDAATQVSDAERYASRGLAVFSIDYQLSTRREPSWPTNIQDVICAVRHVRSNAGKYGVDPQKMAILGHSAGAHLSSLAGALDGDEDFLNGGCGDSGVSPEVSLVMAYYGGMDLTTLAEQSGGEVAAVEQMLGVSFEDGADKWREASPSTYLDPGDPVYVVAHGTSDRLIPFDVALSFYQELEPAGVAAHFVRVEGGRHGGPAMRQETQPILEPLMRTILLD